MHHRFLHALGCAAEAPTLGYLQRLIAAHQRCVPYESVSKLHRLALGDLTAAGLEDYLEGQEAYGFGGTCMAQNAHFVTLLVALGFDAILIGVTSGGQEDAHASCLVRFATDAFHVDLGLMSTFTGPLALRGPPVEKTEGYRLWRFIPRGDGVNYEREMWKDGAVRRSFVSHGGARELPSFAPAIRRSFVREAIFMQNICVFKVIGAAEHTLWNREYHVVSPAGSISRTLASVHEMEAVLGGPMELPKMPIAEAVRIISERNGVVLFP